MFKNRMCLKGYAEASLVICSFVASKRTAADDTTLESEQVQGVGHPWLWRRRREIKRAVIQCLVCRDPVCVGCVTACTWCQKFVRKVICYRLHDRRPPMQDDANYRITARDKKPKFFKNYNITDCKGWYDNLTKSTAATDDAVDHGSYLRKAFSEVIVELVKWVLTQVQLADVLTKVMTPHILAP